MARTIALPQCAAEIQAVLQALDDPCWSAVAFTRSVIQQIAETQFPSERIITVRIELIAFEKQVRTHGNDDSIGLRQAALQLLRFAQALARPVPVPQPDDAIGQLPAPPQCATEIEAILSTLDDYALTAEAFVRSIIKQIADLKFPPERTAVMRSELLAFERQVRTHGNHDAIALREAALQLFRRAQELARPIPIPSPDDIVNSIFATLQDRFGWASATIDLLRQELKRGETVSSCDADGITTNLRRINKEDLIVRYRPVSMTENHFESWRKQHLRDASLYTPPASDSER